MIGIVDSYNQKLSNSRYSMEQAGKIQGTDLKLYKATLMREEQVKRVLQE